MYIRSSGLRAFLLTVGLFQSVFVTPSAAEQASEVYRSRYTLAGFLLRASAVCGNDKKDSERFVRAGFGVLGTSELKRISKAYPKTIGQWMKEGGEAFNERVMSDGITPACAFAVTERERAGGIATNSSSEHDISGTPSDGLGDVEYVVSFKGTCKFKFLNRDSFFPCDPLVLFTNYKTHRSAFTFTAQDSTTVFVFEGGKDRQPNLENYYLSLDTAKFGESEKDAQGTIKGAQGQVQGECYMHMNGNASEYYEIKCDALDRKSGLEFNFDLTNIVSFEKQ